MEHADITGRRWNADAESDECQYRPCRRERQVKIHREQHRPRGQRGNDPHEKRPSDERHEVPASPHTGQPLNERAEDPGRSVLDVRPADGEPREQPGGGLGCDGQRDEDRHGDEVDGEQRGRGVLEDLRYGDEKDENRQGADDGEAVQHALDDQRAEHGPEAAAPPASHDVDAHELTGAQRQDVVGHVADHHGGQEPRGPIGRSEQVAPARGAHAESNRREQDADGRPAEVRVTQALGDLREVHGREQVGEERHADRDAECEPEAAQPRSNRKIRGPAEPAPRR